MSTLWRIAGMLALATGLIMLINSCSGDSTAAVVQAADQAQVARMAAPRQSNTSLISPRLLIEQGETSSAIAGLQPNFDARPLQLQDGPSLEVETSVTG